MKADYLKNLKNVFQEREIEKQGTFKKSLPNIKLSKFSGLNYSRDIYTFTDESEKKNFRTTPKRMLSKPLQSIYLEDHALTLESSKHGLDIGKIKESMRRPKIDIIKKIISFRRCRNDLDNKVTSENYTRID